MRKRWPRIKTPSIKNSQGKIVHRVEEILEVWEKHFKALGTPMASPDFNENHYQHVTSSVRIWLEEEDMDVFCTDTISQNMVEILCQIFNWILITEYIPLNFRRGVQIPLYKGKNTSIVEVNNYRGITLLSTFDKLFEIII